MLSSVASGGDGKNPYAVLPESKMEFSGVGGMDDDSPQARVVRRMIEKARRDRSIMINHELCRCEERNDEALSSIHKIASGENHALAKTYKRG
jgi:hypothetical protein